MKRQKAREILSRLQQKGVKPVVHKGVVDPAGKRNRRNAAAPKMMVPRAGFNYQPTEAPW